MAGPTRDSTGLESLRINLPRWMRGNESEQRPARDLVYIRLGDALVDSVANFHTNGYKENGPNQSGTHRGTLRLGMPIMFVSMLLSIYFPRRRRETSFVRRASVSRMGAGNNADALRRRRRATWALSYSRVNRASKTADQLRESGTFCAIIADCACFFHSSQLNLSPARG